MPWEDRP